MISSQPLIIDIETVPHRSAEYRQSFPKSKKRPGIHAIISQVVCIGIHDGIDPSCLGVDEFDTEQAMLEWFSGILREHKNAPLVGFNIKNFDLPLLQIRAAKYGIKLEVPDRRSQRIIDLYDFLGGRWSGDISSCSLRELIWFMYGERAETPGGDNVAELFLNGKISEIKAHCLEDVQWTSRLYTDFRGILW
jgi:DNA polymerase elongation subunit (family B)